MKTLIKIFYTCTLATSLMLLSGCNDFLEIPPNDRLTLDNFYQSESDLQVATASLYNKVWFDFNDKFYYGLGDGRSNVLCAPTSEYIYPFRNFTETAVTGPLTSAWGSFYIVIGQANTVINAIRSRAKNVTEEQKNAAIAEARFMRGTAYWYLASLWGDAIIIEDNIPLISNPVVHSNPRKDVFEFSMRDLEFAAKYLPETVGQAGRLTKWSAFGMLSRVYLAFSGISDNPNSGIRDAGYLELAQKAAEKVCEESGLSLMDNYADLFTIANKNNRESLFALQWVPGLSNDSPGGWGVINTQQAYFACGTDITGNDAAWGWYTVASYNMMCEYETKDSIRRKATFMANGDYYPELTKSAGGYTYTATLNSHKICNIKKGVVGSFNDTGGASARMNSGLNTYMLRLAEVYLNYAEAVLGNNSSTSDPKALLYFNKVRLRAGVDPKDEISYEDIKHERKVEFAMEGLCWYDEVSRAYYKQQEVLNQINAEGRDKYEFYEYDKTTNTCTATPVDVAKPVNTALPRHLLLPYPETESLQNPYLSDPVPYVFTEEKITDLFNQ